MLIEFRVSNFRSIGEEQILSLIPATNQKEYPENILHDGKYDALNAIAIYGANGSGKSNLLRAMTFFSVIINSSAKSSSTDKLLYDPFLLREGWAEKPTRFEIIFSLKDSRYRYGFEYNQSIIIKEWLFRKGVGREVNLFEREKDVINPSSALKGRTTLINTAIEATRDNGLFFAALDMLNITEVSNLYKYLGYMMTVDGIKPLDVIYNEGTWANNIIRDMIIDHIKELKLGLIDVEAKPRDEGYSIIGKEAEYQIFAKHNFYDANGEPTDKFVTWDYLDNESSGSIKALEISGPVLACLTLGSPLVIDEIEAKMHPLLTLRIINLFINKETNPRNAQLIFSTHDTNLLSYAKLRRDQIYFAEKNAWESTEIYSLSDFVYTDVKTGDESKERPDTDKEKRYIEGRYGAIPVLGPLSRLKSGKWG